MLARLSVWWLGVKLSPWPIPFTGWWLVRRPLSYRRFLVRRPAYLEPVLIEPQTITRGILFALVLALGAAGLFWRCFHS